MVEFAAAVGAFRLEGIRSQVDHLERNGPAIESVMILTVGISNVHWSGEHIPSTKN